MKQVRAMISGRVQGVWFRNWTIEQAKARGLDGWVRNCVDGQVEAVFKGEEKAIEEMIEACHKGPSAANVEAVSVTSWQEPVEPGFTQRPTADPTAI